MSGEYLSPGFAQKLQSEGYPVGDIITDMAKGQGLRVLRNWTGLPNEVLKTGVYDTERDLTAPKIYEAILSVININSNPDCTFALPGIKAKVLSRMTGLSPQEIIRVLTKFPFSFNNAGTEFFSQVNKPEFGQERLTLSDCLKFGLSAKRVSRAARYLSRKPGGGSVQKAGLQGKNIDGQIRRYAWDEVMINLTPAKNEEKEKAFSACSDITENGITAENRFTPLCSNLEVLENVAPNTTLCIGFGVDGQVPLRVISYPLLAYEFLRANPEAKLQMYTATQFADLFDLSPEQAQESAERTKAMVLTFIATFLPDIAGRISFIPTFPIEERSRAIINEFADVLSENDEIKLWARERNGFRSLQYLAAHALYMRDPLPINPNLYLVPTDSKPVVMVGGNGELIPWKARMLIQDYVGNALNTKPVQIFTKLGRRPPYFRFGSEPTMDQQITREFLLDCPPEIFRDFAALFALLVELDYLSIFELKASITNRNKFLDLPETARAIDEINSFSQIFGNP